MRLAIPPIVDMVMFSVEGVVFTCPGLARFHLSLVAHSVTVRPRGQLVVA